MILVTSEILPQVEAVLKDAGTVLVDYQLKLSSLDIVAKADGSLVSTADFASNELIIAGLEKITPGAIIISEETDQDTLSSNSIKYLDQNKPIWILDPLDGTKVFLDGKNTFSIQLALYLNNRYQLGFSYFPAQRTLLVASFGEGAFILKEDSTNSSAFINGERLKVSQNPALQMGRIYGRGAPEHLANYCSASDNSGGHLDSGDAFKQLSQGLLDGVYIAPKVLSIWDVAASHVIVTEAGGVSNIAEMGHPYEISNPIDKPIIMGNDQVYKTLRDQTC